MFVSRKKYDKLLSDLAAQQTLTRRAREDKALTIEKLGSSEAARRRAGGIIAALKKAGSDLATVAETVQADGKIADRRAQVEALEAAIQEWDTTSGGATL